MPDYPTVHLWYPLVGTDLICTFPGSDLEVHLPVSIGAGVANECGDPWAAQFLDLVVRAAVKHAGAVTDFADFTEDFESVLDVLGWESAGRLEVLMEASLDPSVSRVIVTTHETLSPWPSPGFPDITPIPQWQGKTENLREPRRFTSKLPALVTARAGGRPGWGARRGIDICGQAVGLSGSEVGFFGGPRVLVVGNEQVTVLEAKWWEVDRASGEVAAVTLSPVPDRPLSDDEEPEARHVRQLREGFSNDSPADDHRKYNGMNRLMVTVGTFKLVQVGDELWEVRSLSDVTRCGSLLEAIEVLEAQATGSTQVTFHDGLDEVLEECELHDHRLLFVHSPGGLWCVESADSGSSLWVPKDAHFDAESVFELIGTFGERGYFVTLYRWEENYLFNWDEGWEDRNAGWEVLGKVTKQAAVAAARGFAAGLLVGVPDDFGLLDEDDEVSDDDE